MSYKTIRNLLKQSSYYTADPCVCVCARAETCDNAVIKRVIKIMLLLRESKAIFLKFYIFL